MLFDLKGRRRHAVQATYIVLAVLMGGGLVLFGIGGGTNGGLLDAFKGGGGSSGDSAVQKRIDNEKKQLALNPKNEAVLKSLVRDNYQLAAGKADPNTGAFTGKGAKDDLAQAGLYWQKYLATNPKTVDPSLAATMVQVYGDLGLNKPAPATQAAEVVAEAQPNANAYLQLARYAQLAGQTRKSDLAGQKAIALAPKSQRSSVKALLKQIKAGSAAPTSTTGGGG